jgi:hypothetical protein
MYIRAIAVLTFLMMTLSSTVEVFACTVDPSDMNTTGVIGIDGYNAGVPELTTVRQDSDCQNMQAESCFDGCTATCLSYGSTLRPSALFTITLESGDLRLDFGRSVQVLSPHKYRFLRPPIS